MRFKLDENIGNSFAAVLEAAGHDVSTVVRQHMAGADDRRVYEVCVSEQRTLVTFDLDFANPLDYNLIRHFTLDPTTNYQPQSNDKL